MDTNEPSIQELTTQQLVGFVETGAPISADVAKHLKILSPEQRANIAAGIEFEDPEVSPNRQQWLANMASRIGLIDLMAQSDPPLQLDKPDLSESAAVPATTPYLFFSREAHIGHGRHTRASLGQYLSSQQ